MNAEAWGVEPGYWDVSGHWHDVPGETLADVLQAMGASGDGPPHCAPLVTVAQHGPWPELPAGSLALEDGGRLEFPGPAELPLGYHTLSPADGAPPVVVAVCPSRCPGPAPGWGWSVQLYAARSANSWGIGDFGDLALLVRWAEENGASFVLLNPLHAPAPGPVPEASPYFPSSRCFLNPVYLRVDNVPGASAVPHVAKLAETAKQLNSERLIDRKAVWACKSEALEAIFEQFEGSGGDDRFQMYMRGRGKVLDDYTSFCVIAERFGLPWWQWPEYYRRPNAPGVAELAGEPEAGQRKRYYAWLQWLCEQQLSEAVAGTGIGLMCDLAVGVDGGGADAWLWQEVFALQMRVGAPPDDFNRRGQDWGLPPWSPWQLKSAAYGPYIEMLRSVLKPAKGLRMDHVMGLFRLFWVPLGQEPSRGAYVRYPWEDMVALLRLEAWRAGAYVVGEDLGTVEDHVRQSLGSSGVLSYKIFWFEDQRPHDWAYQALGAVTTHDLPTVAGAWTGADVEAQRSLGLPVNEAGCAAMHRRIVEWAGCEEAGGATEAVDATYACLASAPCVLLAATLEDAAADEKRPNMPGTIDQWPNWRLALPVPLEELCQSDLAAAIAGHMAARSQPAR